MERQVTIEYSEDVKEFLANQGFDPLMGARPMSRTVDNLLKKPLAKEINFGKLEKGGSVKVKLKDGALVFEIKEEKKKKKDNLNV
jgi:ATP-dependent Clp protease ATP-binding subunit ClpA